MNSWFSSDWHLGHNKIISITERPFSTIDEMNKTIMDNYKEVMSPGDHFYNLGDFMWYWDIVEYFFKNYYHKSHHFFWILGNHDQRYRNKIFKLSEHIKNFHVYDLYDTKINDQPITMCHYPMFTWNKSHFGAWQLYGHHHRDFDNRFFFNKDRENKKYLQDNIKLGKQLNVSCDLYDYRPISFKTAKELMKEKADNWDLIKR